MLDTNKIDSELYRKLSENERDMFEILISESDINKMNHIRYNQPEIDELINKYNILKGEILIGNDNPDLLKDLKIIILRLVNYNVLTMKEITPLLQQIFLLI